MLGNGGSLEKDATLSSGLAIHIDFLGFSRQRASGLKVGDVQGL